MFDDRAFAVTKLDAGHLLASLKVLPARLLLV